MSSTKKNFLYNSAYQLLILLIPLITTPYLSRVLGANGVGTYSYYYSVSNYFVIFILLGLNNYGNRTIAKVRDCPEQLSKTFWQIYLMQFILGTVVNFLYLFYVFFLSSNRIISFTMWLYVLSGMFDINWFFFGIEKFKLTVTRNTIIKLLTTVLIFILVKKSSDVILYCLILTGGMFLSQIVVWPYLFKEVSVVKPDFSSILVHLKPNIFLFFTVIAVSVYKIMDKIMLGSMTSTVQVGYFESAEKLINVPIALIVSLGTVMLPKISNMIVNKTEGLEEILYKSILFAMFLSSSLCFGLMGVSKEFVPLFFGDGFETCIYLLLILLPSCLFLAFANVIRTQYLLPHQMDKVYVISAFLGAIFNMVVNLILIPRIASLGAATATLGSELVVCIYQCSKVRGKVPILKFVKSSIPFVVSGVVMYIFLFNLSLSSSLFLTLIFKIIIGVVLYFTVLYLLLRMFYVNECYVVKEILCKSISRVLKRGL
ncbi:Membrane protein involved in the export of O-antigen and teichoic acid [Streptococcus equinus]|nr:Membrane protein involved in the export of O-antigen and teichoic acid [Streptococcus equinus]